MRVFNVSAAAMTAAALLFGFGSAHKSPSLSEWEEIMGEPSPTVVPGDYERHALRFHHKGDGQDLFDLSDPEELVVVKLGRYAVQCVVRPLDRLPAGAQFEATMHLDYRHSDSIVKQTSAPAVNDGGVPTQFGNPSVTLSGTWVFPKGATLRIDVSSTVTAAYVVEECGVVKLA